MGKEILINKMCTGSFTINNIGHEIINYFKTDIGEEYLYVLPYGGMSKKHNNKIKYVLLTSSLHKKSVQIIAKAEVEEQIHFDGDKGSIEAHNKQLEQINNRNISYGGCKVNQIFKNNIYNDIAIYATFKVKSIIKPKKELFITNDNKKDKENYIYINKQISSSSLKSYISSEVDYADYNILENAINNKSYWSEDDVTTSLNVNSYTPKKEERNFLDLIEKENDEQIYTNLFYYWFNKKDIMNRFINKYISADDNYSVKKEKITTSQKGRMDILAEGKNNIVIIENKIKSGLNGIDKEKNISQLDTYFNDAIQEYQEKGMSIPKNIYGFIFVPDYCKEKIEQEKKIYKSGEKFIVITYSNLLEFFLESKNEFMKDIYFKYYDDFLFSLKKHTYKSYDEKTKIDMEEKFISAINNIK